MPDSGSQSNPKSLRTLSHLRRGWERHLPCPGSHHQPVPLDPKAAAAADLAISLQSWSKALLWSLMKFKSNWGSGSIRGFSGLEQEITAGVNTCRRITKGKTGSSTLSDAPKNSIRLGRHFIQKISAVSRPAQLMSPITWAISVPPSCTAAQCAPCVGKQRRRLCRPRISPLGTKGCTDGAWAGRGWSRSADRS